MSGKNPIVLPQGVKDFVPSEAGGVQNVESELLDEFVKWGYKHVITPLFENLETINTGLSEDLKSRVLKFVDPSTGDVVALRPDITPQISRIVATRMSPLKEPQRLCYSGRVVRFERESSGRGREVFQAGCELVGAKNLTADAEIMALSVSALRRLGLGSGLVLDIGHSGVLRAIEKMCGSESKRVRAALEMKSKHALSDALGAARISASERKVIMELSETREADKVLLVMEKLPALKRLTSKIRKIMEVLEEHEIGCDIWVYACDVRDLNYYTDATFQILHESSPTPLIVGGRYDNLVKRYGYDTPATGFAADVEGIVKVTSREKGEQTVHFVVIPAKPSLRKEAIRLSKWLRSNGFQVITETSPRPVSPRGKTPPTYGVISIDSPTKLRLLESKSKTVRRFSNLEELIEGGL
ncbi:ATP phosphoribosyltransferase regulatory subunit [Candidatus Mycalebacterium sp.]